jgi:hypothetical protein
VAATAEEEEEEDVASAVMPVTGKPPSVASAPLLYPDEIPLIALAGTVTVATMLPAASVTLTADAAMPPAAAICAAICAVVLAAFTLLSTPLSVKTTEHEGAPQPAETFPLALAGT